MAGRSSDSLDIGAAMSRYERPLLAYALRARHHDDRARRHTETIGTSLRGAAAPVTA